MITLIVKDNIVLHPEDMYSNISFITSHMIIPNFIIQPYDNIYVSFQPKDNIYSVLLYHTARC